MRRDRNFRLHTLLEKVKLTFACRRTALAEVVSQSAASQAWSEMKEAAN
jgi:hypothetical protein